MSIARRSFLAVFALAFVACSSGEEGGSPSQDATPATGNPEQLAKFKGFASGAANGPFGLAVDGGFVYVAVFKADDGVPTIARIPAAGGAIEAVVAGPGSSSSVAVANARIYFDDDEAKSIESVASGGGDRKQLVASVSADELLVAPPRLYFSDANVGGTGTVGAVPLDGGAITELVKSPDRPLGLALEGSSLFVGQLGPGSAANDRASVLKVDVATGTSAPLAKSLRGVRGVVADATNVYATINGTGTEDGEVVAIDRASGATRVLATGQKTPWGLAFDGSSLYWVNRGGSGKNGSVQRMSKDGGAVTVIASGQGEPRRCALDDRYVYWTNFGSGEVMRAPK